MYTVINQKNKVVAVTRSARLAVKLFEMAVKRSESEWDCFSIVKR